MIRPYLPLNGLRAFEAAARHSSFTKAAIELNVTPAALGHQVKALEERLGRAACSAGCRAGLALTDEGQALLPVLREAFDRMAARARPRSTTGGGARCSRSARSAASRSAWLLPRLAAFAAAHPGVDLRLSTNNNRVDIAEEGLDFAIRFGDGAWHGTEAVLLFDGAADRAVQRRDRGAAARARGSCRRDPAPLLSQRGMAGLVRGGRGARRRRSPARCSIRAALMVEAALAGHGVALAPRESCSEAGRRGPSRPRSTSAAIG